MKTQIGSTSVLLNVVPLLWSDASTLIKARTAARSSLLRKYIIKLTQRIGLTILPPRSATWHYVVSFFLDCHLCIYLVNESICLIDK